MIGNVHDRPGYRLCRECSLLLSPHCLLLTHSLQQPFNEPLQGWESTENLARHDANRRGTAEEPVPVRGVAVAKLNEDGAGRLATPRDVAPAGSQEGGPDFVRRELLAGGVEDV